MPASKTKTTIAELPAIEPMAESATEIAPAETETDDLPVFDINKKDSKRYFEAIGRRKRAIARVRVFTANPKDSAAEGGFTVNDKSLKDFFGGEGLMNTAMESLNKLKAADHFRATVKVSGGGVSAQAEAIRLGLARALVKFDLNFRKKLKKSGLLRRDPREKERRKYGLKKARRAPQFSKR